MLLNLPVVLLSTAPELSLLAMFSNLIMLTGNVEV